MKRAIVTGGAGGLGKAISRSLAAAGYRVAVFDLDADAAAAAAAEIENGESFQVDVTDEGSVAAAMALLGDVPNLLVNNAGISAIGGMLQPVSMFRRIIEVNLTGAYVMCQAVAEAMAARGSGVIINITSAAGTAAAPIVGAYGPSKAALENLTRAMALQYGPTGVRVNAIAPGFVNAGIGEASGADPEITASRIRHIPARRLGAAQDVAAAVAFLASDAASYIHGHELIIDGGLSLSSVHNSFAS